MAQMKESWWETLKRLKDECVTIMADIKKNAAGIAQNAADIAVERAKQPLRYKGNVATVSALPTEGNEVGDMWNVTSTENNYVWNGESWDPMAGVLNLPEASTIVSGVSKLGTDLTVSDGASVGKNASGQLFVGTGSVSTPGVYKLGTSVEVSDNTAGMVGLTGAGGLAVRFATDSLGGVVKTGGNGVGTNNNVLNLNLRAQHSGLNFDNRALYVNTDEQNEHPAEGEAASVATNVGGKLVVVDASTTRKGAVKIAEDENDEGATSVLSASKSKELLGAKADKTSLREEAEAREKADAESEARLDALEAKFPVLGLGWFKPDSSVEADSTAGRLDDKRRILIGLDKTGKVVKLEYGSFGSDGLWHDTTGIYAGIYVKRWDHEKQEWKTPVPAPHATGKTYSENTIDRLGILPWAGIRDAVLDNEVNGVAFEQHVVKIPQFRFCKKYHATIRWKSEASDTGYVDETGELKIMLSVPPAESFSIGYDADGLGTNVVTLTPEDFPVHDAFVVPDNAGGTREASHVCVAKYFGTHLSCGGTTVVTSRPVASRNSAPNRGQGTQYCENNNLGTLGSRYTTVHSTAAQLQLLTDLMEVEFATRDIQSVNTGACSNNSGIGMNTSSEWQFCNAENLDDFARRGLEEIRASGWVDYYGKLKTESDRASNPEAAETQSTGKEYLTRFNWRGIEGGLFESCANFVSDMELLCYASEEIPSGLVSADFAQELVAAGVATEDAETGTLTAVSGGCHIMAIRNPETPFSEIYRGTGSAASDRDNFVANYVSTGKYRVVELVAPTTNGSTQYFENVPYGMEWAQKTSNESDGNVHGVDFGFWANASVKMRRIYVGGYCVASKSEFGLRYVAANINASIENLPVGPRACFVPIS